MSESVHIEERKKGKYLPEINTLPRRVFHEVVSLLHGGQILHLANVAHAEIDFPCLLHQLRNY